MVRPKTAADATRTDVPVAESEWTLRRALAEMQAHVSPSRTLNTADSLVQLPVQIADRRDPSMSSKTTNSSDVGYLRYRSGLQMKQIGDPAVVPKVLLANPLILSKLHLTGLLGNRFVIITHLGRKTGRGIPKKPVEVVRFEPSARAMHRRRRAGAHRRPGILNISARPALAYRSCRSSIS